MARRSPRETSVLSPDRDILSSREAQVAHDQALTTTRNTSVIPEIAAARERLQAELSRRLNVSKADVILGFQEAILDAKLLADPGSQIKGWREIGLLLGYYEPQVVTIRTEGPIEKVREAMRQMSPEQLQDIAGEAILDADFYPVVEANGTQGR